MSLNSEFTPELDCGIDQDVHVIRMLRFTLLNYRKFSRLNVSKQCQHHSENGLKCNLRCVRSLSTHSHSAVSHQLSNKQSSSLICRLNKRR